MSEQNEEKPSDMKGVNGDDSESSNDKNGESLAGCLVVIGLIVVIVAGILGYKTALFNDIKSHLSEPIQWVEKAIGYVTPISEIADSTLRNLQYYNLERYWVVLQDGNYVDSGNPNTIFDDYTVEFHQAYHGDLNDDNSPDVIVMLKVREGSLNMEKLCFIINKDGNPVQTQILHFNNQYVVDVRIREDGWFDVDTREYTGSDPPAHPSLLITHHYRYYTDQIYESQSDVHGQVMQ